MKEPGFSNLVLLLYPEGITNLSMGRVEEQGSSNLVSLLLYPEGITNLSMGRVEEIGRAHV